jgi:Flp pilus assembly protein TadG
MQTTMRTRRRRARSERGRFERGQALAEFAMIAPLFVILLFGFIDTARLYQSWVTIQHAAREGARYGVTGREDCAAATPTRVNCIEHVTRAQTDGLTDPTGDLDVYVRSWEYPAYADPPTDDDPGQQCDALEVRIEYEFTPSTPLVGDLFGPVTMVARERLLNEPFGPCS